IGEARGVVRVRTIAVFDAVGHQVAVCVRKGSMVERVRTGRVLVAIVAAIIVGVRVVSVGPEFVLALVRQAIAVEVARRTTLVIGVEVVRYAVLVQVRRIGRGITVPVLIQVFVDRKSRIAVVVVVEEVRYAVLVRVLVGGVFACSRNTVAVIVRI